LIRGVRVRIELSFILTFKILLSFVFKIIYHLFDEFIRVGFYSLLISINYHTSIFPIFIIKHVKFAVISSITLFMSFQIKTLYFDSLTQQFDSKNIGLQFNAKHINHIINQHPHQTWCENTFSTFKSIYTWSNFTRSVTIVASEIRYRGHERQMKGCL